MSGAADPGAGKPSLSTGSFEGEVEGSVSLANGDAIDHHVAGRSNSGPGILGMHSNRLRYIRLDRIRRAGD